VSLFLRLLCLSLILAATTAPLLAQRVRDTNFNSWWIYSGDHPLRGRWGVILEYQERRSDFAALEQQHYSRVGVTYRLSPNAQISTGYQYIHTGQYGDFPFARAFGEHRIFQQLILRQSFKRLDFEHRYRNDMRWLQAFTGQGDNYFWRYQNRARYQIKVAHPVKGDWYLFGGNEVIIPYGPNFGAVPFDQNRAFAGVGYKVTPRNRLEFGYLNQFLFQRNGRVEESNHTIRVQWTSTVPLLGK
jgi:hypothetical protein